MNAGGTCGAGSYFTMEASKADAFTEQWEDSSIRRAKDLNGDKQDKHSDPGMRHMFVVRVLLGEVHKMQTCDSSLHRPPLGSDWIRCDSVLDKSADNECNSSGEFVLYNTAQAIPQFVIVYKHR